MTIKNISAEDQFLICELAAAGMWAYYIGAKFNIGAAKVCQICRKHGVTVLSRENQKQKMLEQVILLLKAGGYTTAMICDKTGAHEKVVQDARRKLKLGNPPSASQVAATRKAKAAIMMVKTGDFTVKQACKIAAISTATYCKYKRVVSDL